MFTLKGGEVLRLPVDALRIAVPLALYFLIQFTIGFALGRLIATDDPRAVAVAFTAAGNNFELAIAAIASFGPASPVAFATIIGPLVEVPVLIGLVTVALHLVPLIWPKGKSASPTKDAESAYLPNVFLALAATIIGRKVNTSRRAASTSTLIQCTFGLPKVSTRVKLVSIWL